MSDMEDYVDVRITRRGKLISKGCYKLPVSIGRGEHNSVRIGHSPQDKTISRTHAVIQQMGDRLQLLDKSANGTMHRGERIKQGKTVDLEAVDGFEIFEFRISLSRAKHDPSIPVLFEAHVLVDGQMKGSPLLIGEMLLLCFETNKGYRFDQIPAQADFQAIFTRHRLEDERLFAAVGSDDGKGVLAMTEHQPRIMINRRVITELTSPLHARDVIEIGNVRIELYPPGEKSLKCSNPACQLLNSYDLNGNCRFCSFALVGAVTRLASATSKPKS
jgi:pSer/pThr/pTyr-binding forkhead associated (FHA) protein